LDISFAADYYCWIQKAKKAGAVVFKNPTTGVDLKDPTLCVVVG